jgi:hypothetical protein
MKRAGIVGGFLFAAVIVSILTSVIWPGQAKLLAPVFCDDARPDAFVVSDTYHDSDGTSTNFTLYCVGPRGEHEDVGWLYPFLGIVVMNSAALLVLGAVATTPGRLRRARSRQTSEPHVHTATSRPVTDAVSDSVSDAVN